MIALRDYQTDTLERVGKAEARGVRKQLVVAATGLGKTIVFSALAQQRGGRTLILAHRDELVSQAVKKVREVWPDADVGIVKAEQNDVTADVVVASVQTLARASRLTRLTAPIVGSSLLGRAAPFGLVVIDEAHHATADSYKRIVGALNAGEPDGPLLVGVTATPDRGDGKGLVDVFDEIVASYDLLWGIRSGYLCDLTGARVMLDSLDMTGVKTSGGDYVAGETGRRLEDAGAPEAIAQAYTYGVRREDGTRVEPRGRRTLVFTPTVATSRATADALTALGVRAEHIDGETPIDERRATLAAFARGEIEVLSNCMVLTEGFDDPGVSCIVVARPTKSRALYTQMIGRGTRKHPDKDDCLVLDVVGASAMHSLVTIPSLFGVDVKQVEKKGATLTAAIEAHEAEEVRQGRMSAKDAELFHKLREQKLAWVRGETPLGALAYTINIERETDDAVKPIRETVVLHEIVDQPDVWTVRVIGGDSKSRILMAEVSMELAQGVGEDYVRKNASDKLTNVDAYWRTRRPTKNQKEFAQRLGIKIERGMKAGDVSDAIDAVLAKRKMRRAAGAKR